MKNFVFVLETESGLETAEEVYIVEATTSATEIVLEQAEIVAFWVDRKGLVPGGKKGATYARGRLTLSTIK